MAIEMVSSMSSIRSANEADEADEIRLGEAHERLPTAEISDAAPCKDRRAP